VAGANLVVVVFLAQLAGFEQGDELYGEQAGPGLFPHWLALQVPAATEIPAPFTLTVKRVNLY
jgi:hypothetical protein